MNEEVIKLDGAAVEIVSEFNAAPTAHGDTQEQYGADFYRIGLLENFVVVKTKSEIFEDQMQRLMRTMREGNERERFYVENWMKRDWWNAALIFETANLEIVIERLEEMFDLKPARKIDLNQPEINAHGDSMAVRLNSVMPHNAGKPLVSLQIVNYRLIEIDDRRANQMWQLITTPETGEKLLSELQNLKKRINE